MSVKSIEILLDLVGITHHPEFSKYPCSHFFQPKPFPGTFRTFHYPATEGQSLDQQGPPRPCSGPIASIRFDLTVPRPYARSLLTPYTWKSSPFPPLYSKILVTEVFSHSPCFFFSFPLTHSNQVTIPKFPVPVFVRVINKALLCQTQRSILSAHLIWLISHICHSWLLPLLEISLFFYLSCLWDPTLSSSSPPSYSLLSVLLCWFLLVFLNSEHGSALGLTLGTSSSLQSTFILWWAHLVPWYWIPSICQWSPNFYLLIHFPWNADSNNPIVNSACSPGYLIEVSNLSHIKLYPWSSPQEFSHLLPVFFISIKGDIFLLIAQSQILGLGLDSSLFLTPRYNLPTNLVMLLSN